MNQQPPSRLEAIFGLDLRSLALFRIGIALIVIVDLFIHAQSLTAHYTDQGVLPGKALIEDILHPWYWSFHLINGSLLFQGLLFAIAILIALGMLVGYRTRLATIATWALTISLHNRNPALLFAGDDVLRAMLFWSMFLPLGACYSIDSALNTSTQPLPKRIVSGATIAFIIQLCFIYIWSAAFKTKSPLWWPDGDAVYYALKFDQYATPLGQFLATLSPAFLKLLTFGALVFEWAGALLLFIPVWTSFFRCVAIASFILLHISFGLCFEIGIFSWLGIVFWLAIIPSVIWDKARQQNDTAQRRGLTIYYDADCGFCKKVVYLLRTLLILPGTPLLTAQSEASIYEDMLEKNSWVVIDWQRNRHYKFEAIAYICSLSPLFWIIVPCLHWKPIMRVGTRFYETIATNRKFAGNFTRPFKFRPLEVKPSKVLNIIALSLLFLTTLWNLKSFVDQTVERRTEKKNDWISATQKFLSRRTFQKLDILSYVTRLDQSWSIFAPAPPRDDGWHVILGKLKDGTEVNLLQQDSPISWEKPTLQQRNALYTNMQWRTYFINLNRAIGNKLTPHYAQYLCDDWNTKHQGDQQLESVVIYFIEERTVPPNETQTIEPPKKVWQQSCLN